MNVRKTLVVAAALAIGVYSVNGLANGQAFGRSQAPAPLEGTWIVSIHPQFCSGPNAGEDIPDVPPIKSQYTFGHGGTLIEATAAPWLGIGSRTGGSGWWERTGRTSYQFAFQAFLLEPLEPYRNGIQRFDQTVELQDNDNWSSSGTVQFFETYDLNDSPGLAPYRAGCVRLTGERMY